ncbi:MAG: DNA polymerase IV [Kiritimatiellae bacterium]|jgi:DNA polymerase-4|nr:DNA polymerase IV [Kiritimatiellia bacterium]
MTKQFLHIDMDAFFASVEQLDNPSLKGKPVIVGGSNPDTRGVVAAASYEARKYGVHSAMPLAQAKRLCRDAIFVPVRMSRYVEISKAVFEIFYSYTPMIEKISIDEAFLEVSGAITLFGSPIEIAQKIRNDVFQKIGITCSAGVAQKKYLAKIASDMDKPNGLTVVPEYVVEFLKPMPVSALWGVGKVTGEALRVRGLKTIGDIQNVSPDVLKSALGEHSATHLKNLAFGIDDRSINTHHVEKSISNEITYDRDVFEKREILDALYELVNKVGGRLRKTENYALTVQVKLRWSDFKTITRQKTFKTPVCDDFTLRGAAHEIFEKIDIISGVRLIGFGVSKLTDNPTPSQLNLFDVEDKTIKKRERLSRTVDKVREKFGNKSIL